MSLLTALAESAGAFLMPQGATRARCDGVSIGPAPAQQTGGGADMDDGRHIPAWNGRRAKNALHHVKSKGRAAQTPCCICQQPIDYALPSTDPDGCSVQHIKSRALFPHLTWDAANWAPAHLACNQSEGKTATVAIGKTSRDW